MSMNPKSEHSIIIQFVTGLSMSSALSHRTILALAWPMILANISTPLLGLVDTAVMGHLDSPYYLGAIALGSLIFSFLFWGFGFLRMATTGLTAQAQDQPSRQRILQQGLLLAGLISVLILVFQTAISNLAFTLLESHPDVILHANTYVAIRIWSAPAILMNYVILGWLIGQGSTKPALILILVVNITNIILDIVLVNGLGLKVDGVAIASVIAEYAGLITAIILLSRHGILISQLLKIDTSNQLLSKAWLTLNGNIFIRTICLIVSFAFFTYQGAQQGEIILAANSILLHFITFMAFVLDGFANATEVITGKAIGSRNKTLLKRGLLLTGFWSLLMAMIFSTIYWLFGSSIINLLTDIEEIRITAQTYLIWLIIVPLIAVWSYLFDGFYIGATRSTEMRNTMLFATLFCYFPAWYLLQFMGNDGLWLSLLIFLAARGLAQLVYIPKILKIA